MVLWRLTRRPYADLSGRGGELAHGRWHTRGRSVAYCATPALAVLEVRVHLDLPLDLLPDDYVMMRITAPDDLEIRTLQESTCKKIGVRTKRTAGPPVDTWLHDMTTALLAVPSAVIEVERNGLVNPKHPTQPV